MGDIKSPAELKQHTSWSVAGQGRACSGDNLCGGVGTSDPSEVRSWQLTSKPDPALPVDSYSSNKCRWINMSCGMQAPLQTLSEMCFRSLLEAIASICSSWGHTCWHSEQPTLESLDWSFVPGVPLMDAESSEDD